MNYTTLNESFISNNHLYIHSSRNLPRSNPMHSKHRPIKKSHYFYKYFEPNLSFFFNLHSKSLPFQKFQSNLHFSSDLGLPLKLNNKDILCTFFPQKPGPSLCLTLPFLKLPKPLKDNN
jgi:hypothetical protein